MRTLFLSRVDQPEHLDNAARDGDRDANHGAASAGDGGADNAEMQKNGGCACEGLTMRCEKGASVEKRKPARARRREKRPRSLTLQAQSLGW